MYKIETYTQHNYDVVLFISLYLLHYTSVIAPIFMPFFQYILPFKVINLKILPLILRVNISTEMSL